MLFTRKERQVAILTTRSYRLRITIPVEWDRWAGPLLELPDFLEATKKENMTVMVD